MKDLFYEKHYTITAVQRSPYVSEQNRKVFVSAIIGQLLLYYIFFSVL